MIKDKHNNISIPETPEPHIESLPEGGRRESVREHVPGCTQGDTHHTGKSG